MVADAELWAPTETGGILMGYWADDANVVVTANIEAGPAARHDSTGFQPDAKFQELAVASHYEASGRFDTYLGDWHTHPAGGLALSWRDLRTMRRIARTAEARCPTPVMMVFARGSGGWRHAAWTRNTGRRWAHASATTVTVYA